jgi:hypothetical protein
MSITPDDVDFEALIARLAAPLPPAQRERFRQAALTALVRVPCWGEGAIYRAVAALQREFFDAPLDHHQGPRAGYLRLGQLANKPPVGRANSWTRSKRAG